MRAQILALALTLGSISSASADDGYVRLISSVWDNIPEVEVVEG